MQLNLQPHGATNNIQSVKFDGGCQQILIGDKAYTNSLILTPQSIQMWNASAVDKLTIDDFERLSALPVEVILLGSGNTLVFPDMALSQPLMHKHIGMEVMDTVAACRTYNILVSDGRSVAAALIL